jgi:DNA invertase Pin-like site-specific DNA recombinase
LKHYQEDHSAKDFNRPVFSELLNDLKTKKIRPAQLVIHRMDRFSRNLFESLQMKKQLEGYKVYLYCLDANYDAKVPENMLPSLIQMAIPQIENERRALNTKKGMRQALRSGRWVWKAPKGYGNDNRLVIKSEESKFILEAFEQVALNTKSIDSIRLELVKQGFKVSKQQFLNLLKNPFYIGIIRIEAWDDEKEELVKGIHEPIIDENLFNAVQRILSSRTRRQAKKASFTPLFPLRGHLKCKFCGNKLTASSSMGRTKKYHYYHCQNGCKERFDAENANDCFVEYLSSLSVNKPVAELYLEILKDEFDKNEGSKEKQLNTIRTNISKCEEQKNFADNKYLSGQLPSENYLRLLGGIDEQILSMRQQINSLEDSPTRFDKHLKYGINLINNLPYYYKLAPIDLKHKIIGSIFTGNLIFDENSYRTEKPNLLIELICSHSVSYVTGIKEKTSFSRGQSNWAPPIGESYNFNAMISYSILLKSRI